MKIIDLHCDTVGEIQAGESLLTGISEGQAIVLYEKTKCIGGGVIGF